MNTTKLFNAMLAGVSACALFTAPALAGAPDIHVSGLFGTPLKVHSGNVHFKTGAAGRNAHDATTNYTTTVSFFGTITSDFHGFLFATTFGHQTSSGKCVQPPRKKVHQKYSRPMNGTVKAAVYRADNPCGTGKFDYYGPKYKITNKQADGDAFKGELTLKNYRGYNVFFNENITVSW